MSNLGIAFVESSSPIQELRMDKSMQAESSIAVNDWNEKLKNYLAITIQKYTRGILSRKRSRLNIWIRYNQAAFIIQWAYRNWRNTCLMRALPLRAAYYANMTTKVATSVKRESLTSTNSVEDLTQKIVRNRATYDEIMTIWKHAIELRKAYPSCSTDVILKALIESQSDLHRAMVLCGNAEFVLRNDPELPKHIRTQFLPIGKHVASKQTSLKADRAKRRYKGDIAVDPATAPTPVFSSNVEAIRALRQSGNDTDSQKTHDALLSSILSQSYYSTNHVGSIVGHKFYDSHLSSSSTHHISKTINFANT